MNILSVLLEFPRILIGLLEEMVGSRNFFVWRNSKL